MDNIKQLLDDEIETEFDDLKGLDIGSDEYKVAVDGLVKLVDRKIEIEKIEAEERQKDADRALEKQQKEADRELDERLKVEQGKDTRIDQFLRNGIAIAGIVIPSIITIWGTLKTLKFEETGTVTTIMGRGFVNKLIPKK